MGYLIGCLESLQSVMYIAGIAAIFGAMLTQLFGTSQALEPVWWLLFYVTALTIQIRANSHISTVLSVLAVVSVLMILAYFLGTASTMNFDRYALHSNSNSNSGDSSGIRDFLQCMPYACWFFLGVENMPLTCADTNKSIQTVPKAMLWTYFTAAVSAVIMLFACAAQWPGIDSLSSFGVLSPLMPGFSHAFGISQTAAVLLVLPATYATAFGFLFSMGRQMSAMSKSGLFPKVLSVMYYSDGENMDVQVPVVALVMGSLNGYCVLLVLWFNFGDRTMMRYLLLNICLLASFAVYMSIFVSFIMYRRKNSSLDKGRPFFNPLGKYLKI